MRVTYCGIPVAGFGDVAIVLVVDLVLVIEKAEQPGTYTGSSEECRHLWLIGLVVKAPVGQIDCNPRTQLTI